MNAISAREDLLEPAAAHELGSTTAGIRTNWPHASPSCTPPDRAFMHASPSCTGNALPEHLRTRLCFIKKMHFIHTIYFEYSLPDVILHDNKQATSSITEK